MTDKLVVLDMLWDGPPLRSNGRHHWAAKMSIVKAVRSSAGWRAKHAMANGARPFVGPVKVTLVWTVTDKRVRDAGASAPTLKACLDGVVDAGLLLKDDFRTVVSETCTIVEGTAKSVCLWIEPV